MKKIISVVRILWCLEGIIVFVIGSSPFALNAIMGSDSKFIEVLGREPSTLDLWSMIGGLIIAAICGVFATQKQEVYLSQRGGVLIVVPIVLLVGSLIILWIG